MSITGSPVLRTRLGTRTPPGALSSSGSDGPTAGADGNRVTPFVSSACRLGRESAIVVGELALELADELPLLPEDGVRLSTGRSESSELLDDC